MIWGILAARRHDAAWPQPNTKHELLNPKREWAAEGKGEGEYRMSNREIMNIEGDGGRVLWEAGKWRFFEKNLCWSGWGALLLW